MDIAANEAREIVSATTSSLPDDAEEPIVSKSDSDADAIVRLALLGDASLDELTQIAEGVIYERLSTIDGIAEVIVQGSRSNEFQVQLDMPSLLSRGLTVFDVSDALATLRDDTALGSLEGASQTLALSVDNQEVTVEAIEAIQIDNTTQVADVALVQLLPEESTIFTRVNGQAAISLDITRQSVGNTLAISKAVNVAVTELRQQMPEGVELVIASDDGVFNGDRDCRDFSVFALAPCHIDPCYHNPSGLNRYFGGHLDDRVFGEYHQLVGVGIGHWHGR